MRPLQRPAVVLVCAPGRAPAVPTLPPDPVSDQPVPRRWSIRRAPPAVGPSPEVRPPAHARHPTRPTDASARRGGPSGRGLCGTGAPPSPSPQSPWLQSGDRVGRSTGSTRRRRIATHRRHAAADGTARVASAPKRTGVFAPARGPAWRPIASRIRGARVVVVDDVVTTGATVEACARVLRRLGARDVRVLTLARVARSRST